VSGGGVCTKNRPNSFYIELRRVDVLDGVARRISGAKGVRSFTISDGLFGLSFPDRTAAYFLLEIDRGTMPVVRKGLSRTSFARKLAIFWEGWNARRHVEQFGVAQMRVLTVAPSPERVRNMVAVVRGLTGGKGTGFFLFMDQKTLAASDPLKAVWTSGKGEPVRLAD
jgi:hypothetical protein